MYETFSIRANIFMFFFISKPTAMIRTIRKDELWHFHQDF